MPRHVVQRRAMLRQPRAHWVLLLLGLVVLLGLLTLNGYASGVLGGSARPQAQAPEVEPAIPAAVAEGGPLIRFDGAGPQSRSLPAKQIALTFDDGPDPVWTPRILDVLAKQQAK